MLHPGAGRVTRIAGRKSVRAHPNVVRVRIRAKVGDRIDPRRNVGKNVGHVLLSGPDRDSLLAAIEEVGSTLKIEVDPSVESPDHID